MRSRPGLFIRRGAWISGVLVAVMALAAGFTTVRSKAPDRADAAAHAIEFVPADLYTVKSEKFVRTLPLTGSLVPLTEATVKARVAGELIEVAAREGQAVRKGQVLARIDQAEQHARLAARAADLEAARAQLALAEKNRAMQRALLDRNFISRNAFDTTQSNYEVALARLRASEAELTLARKSLADGVLSAPLSGTVSQRHAQPGERVGVDARILTIVDLSRLELEAALPAASIGEVRIGQTVAFRIDGLGEREFTGRIERINPTTSAGSRSISVYVSIENPGGDLRGGMFAQGALTLERVDHAMAIPASAVREAAGQHFVYALENGAVQRKAVRLGEQDGAGRVNVVAGLDEGTVIVRNNLGPLREGSAARVLDQHAAR